MIEAPPPTSGYAIASMICGLVSLAMCYVWALAGIPAVICGHVALKAIRKSPVRMEGRGLALTGLITGYFSIFIQFLCIVVLIWIFLAKS